MAVASHQTRLVVGALPVSCIATGVETGVMRNMIERTPLCEPARVFIPGRSSAMLSIPTMFDDDGAAGSYWDLLTDNYGSDVLLPITVAPAGFTDGGDVFLAEAYQNGYAPESTADGGVDVGLSFDPTGPALFGQSLDDYATITADANGAAIDGGAASSNGGVAHLHVTAVDGTTPTLDVTIEHSVNGSTGWNTLVTFAQVTTSPAAERVAVAAGTTVRRYLRVVYDVDGTTPSYNLAVAFARS